MKTIPLIIPNFNQRTYLINMINWWNYYTNSAPVYVIDNASTYEPLLNFYDKATELFPNLTVVRQNVNNCGENLKAFITEYINKNYEYYVISNPDIQPHPDAPENFMALFKEALDKYKFHRVGFGLIIEDIPPRIANRMDIMRNEKPHWQNKQLLQLGKDTYKGFKTGIDLTFCLYKKDNGGWLTNKEGGNFANALRLFKAFHFGWYVNHDTTVQENINYFKTARTKKTSNQKTDIKGTNSYAPQKYKDMVKAAGVYETLAVIDKQVHESKKVFYVRFGDGDLLVMNGGNDKLNKHSKELQQKLTKAFQIQNTGYIKGLAVNYPLEKGMKPGLFAPFEYNEKLARIVKQNTKERNFYNPVVFQYLYVFDRPAFDKFFGLFVHRPLIFVGSVDVEVIEKLLNLSVNVFIGTKPQDSFEDFDEIETNLKAAISLHNQTPLVICACGLTTRALAASIWEANLNCHFIDIGSVVDAAANLPTRKWIKLSQPEK